MTLDPNDGFFTPLENDRPFLKMAVQGFAGAGKTYTMALVAVGLHKRIGSTRPIAIFDTERSAKFLRAFFNERGIKVITKKSRTLTDLNESITRCEAGAADILVIDSLSHIWENWLEEYKQGKRITSIQFQHWGEIKPIWKRKFSDPFVTSELHILMTGRAAFTYGKETNEDTGKKELVTTGVKMKVEGETAYEPDILIEMSRHEEFVEDGRRRVYREAMILKDRSTLLDGQTLVQPTYESFAPAIEYLLSDAVPPRGDEAQSDLGLVVLADEDAKKKTDRKVLLEEIEALFLEGAPGQSVAEKKWRIDHMKACFKTGSWTKLTMLPLDSLQVSKMALEQAVRVRKATAIKEEVPVGGDAA